MKIKLPFFVSKITDIWLDLFSGFFENATEVPFVERVHKPVSK